MSDHPRGSPVSPCNSGPPAAPGTSVWGEVVDSLPHGVAVVDHTGVCRELNAAFCRLVGYEPVELIGMGPPFSYVAAHHHEAYEAAIEQALRGEPAAADLTLIHKDGTRIPASLRATPLASAFHGSRCAVLVVCDESARRQAEAALRDSERRWRSVVENPYGFVTVIDRDYRYVFVNRTEPGIKEDEIIGKATPFDFVEPEFHPTMRAAFEKAFREGVTTSFEIYSSVVDQWTASVMGPIFDDNGEVIALSQISRDVTAAKRAERALRASHALEMIGVIGSGIARDLKRLLEPVLGNVSELVREVDRDNAVHRRLAEVSRAVARASELVKRLASFERAGSEAVESFSITALAQDVASKAEGILPADIRLSVDIDEDCPRISGVPWQIQQAIENLCDNARRALLPTGGQMCLSVTRVTVGAEFAAVHGFGAGPAVKIVVRDNGPGATKESLARAFEPFFSTWKDPECAGLGLPTARAIAMRHGGGVIARSIPGDGMAVELYLPADVTSTPSKHPSAARALRILCIDDEAAVLKLTRRVLERAGHTVVAMASPIDALERLREGFTDFDVVISDQIMPRLTGTELAAEAATFAPELPFLIVSGFMDPDSAVPSNVRALLQKPVPVEMLLRKVADASTRR